MENLVAILVLTSPIWFFFLFLWLSTVFTGKSLREQAYDKEVKRRKNQIMMGEIDARMNEDALREYRNERD